MKTSTNDENSLKNQYKNEINSDSLRKTIKKQIDDLHFIAKNEKIAYPQITKLNQLLSSLIKEESTLTAEIEDLENKIEKEERKKKIPQNEEELQQIKQKIFSAEETLKNLLKKKTMLLSIAKQEIEEEDTNSSSALYEEEIEEENEEEEDQS